MSGEKGHQWGPDATLEARKNECQVRAETEVRDVDLRLAMDGWRQERERGGVEKTLFLSPGDWEDDGAIPGSWECAGVDGRRC